MIVVKSELKLCTYLFIVDPQLYMLDTGNRKGRPVYVEFLKLDYKQDMIQSTLDSCD